MSRATPQRGIRHVHNVYAFPTRLDRRMANQRLRWNEWQSSAQTGYYESSTSEQAPSLNLELELGLFDLATQVSLVHLIRQTLSGTQSTYRCQMTGEATV